MYSGVRFLIISTTLESDCVETRGYHRGRSCRLGIGGHGIRGLVINF